LIGDVKKSSSYSEVRYFRIGITSAQRCPSELSSPPRKIKPPGCLCIPAAFGTTGSVSAGKIQSRPLDQEPYWHIERARFGNTREVTVELVMNGKPVAHKNLVANGAVQEISFDVPVVRSSWLAVRILGSSHTNPIFDLVDGKPIRASRESAQWCLAGVNQCWTQKAPKISKAELPDAQAAYDHAREVYTKLIAECAQ